MPKASLAFALPGGSPPAPHPSSSAHWPCSPGARKWDGSLWVASDDRVRGGASRSHLSVDDDGRLARFHGQLDIKTLGGAGFASQQSRPGQAWDLSDYDGIIVAIAGPFPADGKRYVLTLKDSASSSSLLPFRRHARQRASLSWEAAFVARSPGDVHLPWAAFTPTYRGRVVGDAKPLDRTAITQLGLMMRRSVKRLPVPDLRAETEMEAC